MPRKPLLIVVENAFQPAKEIIDAARFAGRADAVQQAYFAMMAEGSSIAIVGNRGIGKTSLARQVESFGRGDNGLLEKLNLNHDHSFDFLTVYFACGTTITDIDMLLSAILTADDCLGSWIYGIETTVKKVDGLAPKVSAKMFGVGAEIGAQMSTEQTSDTAVKTHSLNTIFTNIATKITGEGIAKDGILIVIDEFDQIIDPSGFASFLKALATNAPKVRFCIVGVAKDIYSLMREHESSDRLFAGSIISLAPMNHTELKEIISIAENAIDKYISFSPDARDRLVSLAQGHPYMVHLIGKLALRAAFQADQTVIKSRDIDHAVQIIAASSADPVLEHRYRRAVASSSQREVVLKALANTQDNQGEVWTTNAYKAALDLGVENPSQYVGQLVTSEYGSEIEKLRERYYRFKDSLFAAYVRAHPDFIDG